MMLALIAEALVYRVADVLTALAPLAAIVLAAVLAVAAGTKLIDRDGTAAEFTALGVPRPALASGVVPPVELAIAGLLLARPALGALLACLLLVAFTVVLVVALRSGRSVTCGCLGPLSRRPISASTLVRNGALIALAALASTGPDPDGLLPILPAIEVVLSAGTTALLAVVGHQLLVVRDQIGRLWSVELAGEGPTRRRQSKRAHDDRAVMNGAGS